MTLLGGRARAVALLVTAAAMTGACGGGGGGLGAYRDAANAVCGRSAERVKGRA